MNLLTDDEDAREALSIAPDPPVTPDDPFGHRLRREALAHPTGPVLDDDEYADAMDLWFKSCPVKRGADPNVRGNPDEMFFRVATNAACPVCGRVCETDEKFSYAPGCYVPYAGRRWDCVEMWGRNLTAQERRDIIDWEARAPQQPPLNVPIRPPLKQ